MNALSAFVANVGFINEMELTLKRKRICKIGTQKWLTASFSKQHGLVSPSSPQRKEFQARVLEVSIAVTKRNSNLQMKLDRLVRYIRYSS